MMVWIIIFSIETIALTFLGALISTFANNKFIISPDKNIVTATCYSILLPSCLCSAYPIILSSKKPFLRSYITVLVSMLSPQIILFSLKFLPLKYLIARIILSILIALIVAQICFKLKLVKVPTNSIYNKEIFSKILTGNIFSQALLLFSQSIKPVLVAMIVSIAIKIFLPINYVGKYLLFPSRRIIAILLAGLLKFCAGQEVLILYSLKTFQLNIGFSLAFSIMATGFCISLIPIYLRIYKPAGLIILITVLIITALLISPLSF